MGGYRQLPITPYEPQQSNPLEMLARVNQLKTAQLQQQGLAQENQQRQISIQNQQAGMKAMQAWDGKSMDEIPDLLQKNGADLPTVMNARSSLLKFKTELQSYTKDQLANEKTKNDFLAGLIDQVKSLPPEQQPQAFEAAKAQAVQRGYADPQQAQSMQYQGPEQLDILEKSLMGHSAAIEQAAKQAEAFKNTQQGNEAKANTDLINSRAKWFKDHGMAPGVTPQDASMADWLQKNPGKGPSDYEVAMKKIVPAYNFNLQNQGIGGKGGAPSALAQAVAAGNMKWNDVISPRTPQSVKEQFAQEVLAIKPDFDTAQFGIQAKAAEKATSGTWADTRIAYNTALDHSKQLLTALDALQNGDVKKLNSLRNYFKTELGYDVVPTYSAIANAYNHEVTAVVSKGHITDTEVKTGGAVLPDNASPQQIRSVVTAYNGLMASKRDELDKQIKAGAGNKANSVLNQTAPSQTAAPSEVSATGPNGHKIVVRNGQWVDAQSGQPIK